MTMPVWHHDSVAAFQLKVHIMINHTTKHESYQQPQMSYLHNVKQEGRMKGQTKKLIIILFGKEDI
jgi:hypothetical protein